MAGVAGWGVATPTGAAGRIRRIGVLLPNAPASNHFRMVQRLQELGWTPVLNVEFILRWGTPEQLNERAIELASFRPDLVIGYSDNAVRALLAAIPEVPVLMIASADPVGLGFVDSLRRPGGRVTGTAWAQDPEISAKYVELAAELLPGLRRVGVLYDDTLMGLEPYRPPFDSAVRRLGLTSRYVGVSTVAGIPDAIARLRAAEAQVVCVWGSPIASQYADQFGSAALAARLPMIGIYRQGAPSGMVLTYGPSRSAAVIRTADFIDRILRGARPADLPVEQPVVYEMTVNLRAAGALGLRVPSSLLARADEVIE